VNFWIGNNPLADGTYRPLVPGKQVPAYEREGARILAEQALGRPLAAGEVSSYWLKRSLSWARSEPGAWARLQGEKLGLYWSGYEWPDAVDYYWMKTISWPLALPGLEWSAAALLALWGLLLERRRLALWARCCSSSSAGCSRSCSSFSSRATACRRCRASCSSPRFRSLARGKLS